MTKINIKIEFYTLENLKFALKIWWEDNPEKQKKIHKFLCFKKLRIFYFLGISK